MAPIVRSNPEKTLKFLLILITVCGLSSLPGKGQSDSGKIFKNTIRTNITNPMIFGSKFNVIGYERVIKDYQSLSIAAGRFAFPRLISFDGDSLGITDQANDKGFNASIDYRFYLRKENKYTAPRGIYLGPYYAFNYFSRDLSWDLNTSDFTGGVKTNINLTANLVGVQLGYQFVLWNRMAIDLILMGPGYWFFSLKTNFDTTLSPEDEAMLLEKLNELLKEKFPGSDLVIQGQNLEAKKSTNTTAVGLRYMVNIGFRF